MKDHSSFTENIPKQKQYPKTEINLNIHQKWVSNIHIHRNTTQFKIKGGNKLLTTTWANLKVRMLNKGSQTKKWALTIIPFILNIRKCKLTFSHNKWITSCWGSGATKVYKGAGWNLVGVEAFCICCDVLGHIYQNTVMYPNSM